MEQGPTDGSRWPRPARHLRLRSTVAGERIGPADQPPLWRSAGCEAYEGVIRALRRRSDWRSRAALSGISRSLGPHLQGTPMPSRACGRLYWNRWRKAALRSACRTSASGAVQRGAPICAALGQAAFVLSRWTVSRAGDRASAVPKPTGRCRPGGRRRAEQRTTRSRRTPSRPPMLRRPRVGGRLARRAYDASAITRPRGSRGGPQAPGHVHRLDR